MVGAALRVPDAEVKPLPGHTLRATSTWQAVGQKHSHLAAAFEPGNTLCRQSTSMQTTYCISTAGGLGVGATSAATGNSICIRHRALKSASSRGDTIHPKDGALMDCQKATNFLRQLIHFRTVRSPKQCMRLVWRGRGADLQRLTESDRPSPRPMESPEDLSRVGTCRRRTRRLHADVHPM